MGLKLKSTNGTGSVELNAPANHNINTSFTLPTSNFTGGEWVLADGSGNVNIDSGTLYVDAVNDRVGVGTATPSEKLDVSGTADIKAAIQTTSTGTGANAALRLKTGDYNWLLQTGDTVGGGLRFYDSTNSAERVRISSSGNVGINTTTPSSILDIQTSSGNLQVDALGGTSTKIRQTTTGGILALEGHSGIRFDKSSADEMARFDSSGNFGIGTATPAAKLEVSDSGYAAARLKSTDDTLYSLLRIQDDSMYIIGYGGSHSGVPNHLAIKNNLGSGAIFFTTGSSGTERMRITSAGYAKHTSTGTYGNITGLYHEFNTGASNAAICQFFHRSTNNPYGLIIKFTDAAPDNNLVYFLNCVDSTSTVRFKVHSDGDCDNHDNSYGGTSDEKLKQDIVDATSQWDDIKDLRIRKFKFKSDVEAYGDEARTLLGVVAQEAETVSPGLIKNNPDLDDKGNDLGTVTKSVRYSVLYMKAVKALQEAMERIETLETQNASFEARLAALEGGTTP